MIEDKLALRKYLILALALVMAIFAVGMVVYSDKFDISQLIDSPDVDAALKYYQENYSNGASMEGIRAASVRLGCHQEIRIYRGNEILLRVNYVNGRIYE